MKNYLLLLFFFKAHLAYEKEAILITNSGTNALLIFFLKQSNKNQCPSFLFKALLLGVVVIKKLNKDES